MIGDYRNVPGLDGDCYRLAQPARTREIRRDKWVFMQGVVDVSGVTPLRFAWPGGLPSCEAKPARRNNPTARKESVAGILFFDQWNRGVIIYGIYERLHEGQM